MNTKHKNYIVYCRILEDLYDEHHIFGKKMTDKDYIMNMKYYNIYDWYVSEKLKEERIKKLKKLGEVNRFILYMIF